MSRASNILDWVQAVDEGDPVAFTMDHNPQHQLNVATGYTYQDRGQKDKQGNTRVGDGTKPSGMITNDVGQGRMNQIMTPDDQHMMDVRP
jgi:hypothetical protein